MFEASPSQLSVATGNMACAAAIPATSLHSNVVFKASGNVVQVGAVLSVIVITWVNTSDTLPQASVTVHVFV